MSTNQYNLIQTIGPIEADAANVAAHDVIDLAGDHTLAGGAARIKLSGGAHPSGCKLMFAALASAVADNATASVVLYAAAAMDAIDGTKAGTLVLLPLTTAIAITYGAKTIVRKVGGIDVTLRLADTIETPTLTGYGTSLLAAYASSQPVAYSPAADGIAALLLPQLPAMESLVVDIFGAAADARYILADSHS